MHEPRLTSRRLLALIVLVILAQAQRVCGAEVVLLGEYGSRSRFDMSFESLVVSDEVAAPPPYPGHEPHAPWRTEAAARIDAIRKADLRVRVVDALGQPLPRARIHVEQTRHAFGFGSAVQAWRLRDEQPQHAIYKQKVAELFNLATIENNLKWPPFEGQWGDKYTRAGAVAALRWLEAQRIDVRGHTMVWPGADDLPADLRDLLADTPLSTEQQQQLRDRIGAHITEVAGLTRGRLAAWDVINEPRANHAVMDALPEGDAAMAEWFRTARRSDPTAKLFVNEFNILASGGAVDSASQALLESQLRALQRADAPVDGVGLQSHFRADTISGPEQLGAILDRYAALGLEVHATEFDLTTSDEQLQADYLRDFYTAAFAHEAVTAIVMWGFWEDAHWRPQGAIFRSDWSHKPAAHAYRDLVFNQWWTREHLVTNHQGEAALRVFRGDHRITVDHRGESATTEASLDAAATSVTITLSAPSGAGDGSR